MLIILQNLIHNLTRLTFRTRFIYYSITVIIKTIVKFVRFVLNKACLPY